MMKIFDLFSKVTSDNNFSFEKELIFHSSLFGLSSMLFYMYSRDNNYLFVLYTLYGVIVFALITIFLKMLFQKQNFCLNRCFNNSTFLTTMVLVPYNLLFIVNTFFNIPHQITVKYLIFYLIILLVLTIALYLIYSKIFEKRQDNEDFLNYCINATIPLFIIPFFGPLACEIQYLLKNSINLQSNVIALICEGLLILCSGFLLYYQLYHNRSILDHKKTFGVVILPLFFAGLILSQYYRDYFTITFDMFHHGEAFLPIQQLYEFGIIPFIQIYVTHGLSGIFEQWLYAFIHGYTPVEVGVGVG